MKKFMMIAVFAIATFMVMPHVYALSTDNSNAEAEASLTNGETIQYGTLKEVLAEVEDNSIVKLEKDVTLGITDLPMTVRKTITIDGNNKKISVEGEATEEQLQGDRSVITVVNGGNATITNLTIQGSPKYGLQAYDGGKITVDNVTISNCKYGAILVNGGDLTVKSLNMSENGETGNGIEIGKGEGVTATPKLTLDGTITSDTPESYITIADNDELTEFEVKSTETSEEKLQIKDGHVVITDQEGKIIAESNTPTKEGIELKGETYQEPVVSTDEDNPNTADINLYQLLSLIALSGFGLVFTLKKRFN